MKKTLFFALCFYFCAINIYAGEYAGLTPGISTKKDADKEFGKAVRNMENGRRIDYSIDGHDLKRLSITLKDDHTIIQSIDLFFKETYPQSKIVQWFDLKGQVEVIHDINGNLIEFYKKKGIKLYFEGSNKKDGVFILSYVDVSRKKIAEKKTILNQAESCPAAAKKYYHDSEKYFDTGQHDKAVVLLKKATLCDPNDALYPMMLASSYFELGEHRKAIEAAKHSISLKKNHGMYSLLGFLYWKENDCRSAIPYFEKAIKMKESTSSDESLKLLGVCYYQEARLNESLNVLVKAYKHDRKSPLITYFLAAVSDRLGDKSDAKVLYKRYLRLRHDDKDMNSMARKRLSVLNKENNSKLKEKTSLMTQEIIKTIFGN